MSESDERLTDLEVRYTHLERLYQELSDVVFRQQQLIDGLVKKIADLQPGRVQEGEGADTKPPHY